MQLNNLKTGEIIKLVQSNSTGISYKLYENGIYAQTDLFGKIFSFPDVIDIHFVPDKPKSITDLTNELSLNLIKTKVSAFDLSDDVQNWCIQKGSTGNDTKVRVLIPNELHKFAIQDRNDNTAKYYPLYQIIKFCELNLPANTAILTNNCNIQYLEDLGDAQNVLSIYISEGLVIDYKNTLN